MAVVKDFDGLLLDFNNRFLSNLIREKYDISNIRFKFVYVGRSPMYRTFPTYQDFYNYFISVITDPNWSCINGRFAMIESIKCSNQKLNFPNSYYVRTVTSKVQVQKNFKLDEYRKKFNDSQAELYQRYLDRKFNNYMKDVNTLMSFRKTQYIESCWIDPDYFRGDLIQLLTV